MDERSKARASTGCSACAADRRRRCAPFASVGDGKCVHFPECCNWCRLTWCPNNRARELYASLHAESAARGEVG